jgi:hypothetical protein
VLGKLGGPRGRVAARKLLKAAGQGWHSSPEQCIDHMHAATSAKASLRRTAFPQLQIAVRGNPLLCSIRPEVQAALAMHLLGVAPQHLVALPMDQPHTVEGERRFGWVPLCDRASWQLLGQPVPGAGSMERCCGVGGLVLCAPLGRPCRSCCRLAAANTCST